MRHFFLLSLLIFILSFNPTTTTSQKITNITSTMSSHKCKLFADTLTTFQDTLTIYTNNLEGGLTIFCPSDDTFKNFLPKFKNLTKDDKNSLLLYHAVPIYYSLSMLKSNNGVFNTLATDGKKKFDFNVQNDGTSVTLKTKIVSATITNTILSQDPVGVFALDKVLEPEEIFKSDLSPAPAPAPVGGKEKEGNVGASPPKPSGIDVSASSPAGGPAADESTVDVGSKNDGGVREQMVSMVALSVIIFSMLV